MKSLTGLVFAVMLVFAFSIVTSPAFAANQPVVGVKEGHWIEYDISITGTGTPPPTHDVRWMRFQVLLVDGASLSVNLTVRYANGTFGSAIWEYNFTGGNLGGWTIIPANLNPGDTFYDASEHNHKPVNVTVQGQEQRTVLGAIRTVTYGNDSLRHSKEWDKVTGVFIGSSEVVQNVTNKDGWYIENLTVTTRAVATNLWSPQNRQILGMEQSVYALALGGAVFGLVMAFLAVVVSQRERLKRVSLRVPLLGKKAFIAALTVLLVFLGAAAVTSFFWVEIGLSDAQVNLIMQSLWTSLIVASMGFRKVGNHFVHGVLITVVVVATVAGFPMVIFMSPPSGGSVDAYFTSPLKVAEVVAHSVLSVPAIAFGVWLVALWRPNSTTFSSKSRRIAQWTVILWVLSYVAGVLGYVADYTPLFG
ncbi:MAG TPA: hypothetical protein VLL96_07745 [Candidatus Deferrimicrobiaceae bacterium]|nr:hypothetical protein [Candidatus Deferrimicrobiaceae bacterium]